MNPEELPSLQGSTRQLAWANDIRAKAAEYMWEEFIRPDFRVPQPEKYAAFLRVLTLPRYVRAQYWIDHRQPLAWLGDVDHAMQKLLAGEELDIFERTGSIFG